MIPNIQIQKTDGNLGVANNTDRILAIIGPASAGATNVATSVTSRTDLMAAFTSGPLVEAGSYMIARGLPIVAIRSAATTLGTYGTIVTTGKAGTSAVTAGTSKPNNTYDPIVQVLTGGTVGTAGIIYRYSQDNGVNWSQAVALGTSNTMTLDDGVSFALAAGTLVTGDTWSTTTTAPVATTGDLTAALTALSDYTGEWLRALVLTDADGTILAQLASFTDPFHNDGKYAEVIANTRARGAAETRATYQTAMAAVRAAVLTAEVACCVDQEEMVSEVTGRRLRVPQSIATAARLMLIDDSQDAAAKSDGALPGIFLETAAGARNYHDERRFPGLDVLGFTTHRTWGGRPITPGVYVNNARVLAGPTSDYQFFQLSAIVNRVIETTFSLLQPKLSRSILLDPDTGRIREDVASGLEGAVTAELRSRFFDSGRVSGVRMLLSRNDNIISTNALTFSVQVQPLAYVKQFVGKTGLVRNLPTS